MLFVYTPGTTSGTFQWTSYLDSASVVLMIRPSGANYYSSSKSGSTVITSYGSVSQAIKGNFNGKIMNSSPPYDTVAVSCSNFSVTRSLVGAKTLRDF